MFAFPASSFIPHGPLGRAGSSAAFSGLLLACLTALPARAEDTAPRAVSAPKAVVELFTSQGCSSCPPADKLLGEIAAQPDVIALTLAVDYWDYLGWKDTLAKHGHSLRQKAYARVRGDSKMFTPQMVVNGTAMMIGSDKNAVERSIDTAAHPGVPVTVETRNGRIYVNVGAGNVAAGTPSAEVWLCPVASRMKVDIGRGENEGTEMAYHNVVRGWEKLGDWSGHAATFETALRPKTEGVDAVAVLVQTGSAAAPSAIVGAALHPLP
ncbi:MAG TPA: DUF1223 domain-containing protein [Ancylobacter sp.]